MRIKSLIFALFCFVAIAAGAKDLKTVVFTTEPPMHCANCENRIKDGLKFEKGVKDIITNLDDKTVTVKYDAEKTSSEAIAKALAKVDYKAKEVGASCKDAAACKGEKKDCCKKAEGACKDAAACKGEKKDCCKKAEGACKDAAACKGEKKDCCKKAEGACKDAAACKGEKKDCCKKAEK